MPFLTRTGVASAVAASACALALAAPGAADAAPHHASHHTPKAHNSGHHKPVARPFTAVGLVVSQTSSSITMLASDVRSGKTSQHNTAVTVTLPSRRTASGKVLARRLASLVAGDRISVNGTKSGDAFTAKNFVGHAAPFHVYVGTVTAVDGTVVTVAKGSAPSDDPSEPASGSFTVDVSAATVTVDGAAGSLAAGQTVAVLGSSVKDVVHATSAFAYSVAPAVLSGEVTAVNGTVVTVSSDSDDQSGDDQSGDDQSGDDQSGTDDSTTTTGTTTDLAGATLIVNGVSSANPDAVTVDSRLVALGTDNGDGTFTSTLVFAFNQACTSRQHGDGGQDSGADD